MAEELVRIGDKIISMPKIEQNVRKILQLRASGLSQQEVANLLHLDRTFISRLESSGEIRKGKKIAVFGFPVKNKEEIIEIAQGAGIEFVYVLNQKERWNLVKGKSALQFFNEVMELIAKLQTYEIMILISSQRWLKIAGALFNNEVIFLELGPSPIEKDCWLDPDGFLDIVNKVTLDQKE